MKRLIVGVLLGLFMSVVQAADVVGQRYIDKMSKGGNISIKQAAQSIYNSGLTDTEVLDVAAEVLLQRYPKAKDRDIDTLAWVSKALGGSGNGRYYSVLKEVVESDSHRKLRKYAKKALKEIGDAEGKQYKKGSVNLASMKKAKKKKSVKKSTKRASGKVTIEDIREGMSMQEVYDLLGSPTATTSHQTGKAWIPFNFGARDAARTIAIYKGQGRIVFSHSGYSSTSPVLEVIIDPEENGYP